PASSRTALSWICLFSVRLRMVFAELLKLKINTKRVTARRTGTSASTIFCSRPESAENFVCSCARACLSCSIAWRSAPGGCLLGGALDLDVEAEAGAVVLRRLDAAGVDLSEAAVGLQRRRHVV